MVCKYVFRLHIHVTNILFVLPVYSNKEYSIMYLELSYIFFHIIFKGWHPLQVSLANLPEV